MTIKHVGKETAEILANEFKTLDRFYHIDNYDVIDIPGIGQKTGMEVRDYFNNEKNLQLMDEFKAVGVNPVQDVERVSDILKGQKVVLTGTLTNMTRDEASEIIKQMGGKTKNTSFVIAGENPGSKFDKARELGVKILTEKEFLEMMKLNSIN